MLCGIGLGLYGLVALGELAVQRWYGGEMPVGGSYDCSLSGHAPRGSPVAQADPEFNLHRPRSAIEAVAMKAAAGPGSAYMAGGIDLVNRMKSGLQITDLIYLGAVRREGPRVCRLAAGGKWIRTFGSAREISV
jgi:hypothetical protein